MTDGQFLDLTPREFHVLLDRHRGKAEHAEWISGTVAASIVNHSKFRDVKNWREPADFFPRLPRFRPSKKKPVSRQRLADQIRSSFQPYLEK